MLAHVKELVEQNHEKYEGYGLKGSIFSAGLGEKRPTNKWCLRRFNRWFANLDSFSNQFSLLVIDECHRVPDEKTSSYQKVITHLRENNLGHKGAWIDRDTLSSWYGVALPIKIVFSLKRRTKNAKAFHDKCENQV
ncbi:DEAD/DEAH box helicase family protein [Enterovibrio norvegicus]|uniref:DEAD/DEAH box helicase family protein n=1 Tax=Enterovibrio norvegicus TaxID=188144 RepID=UPI00389A2D2C